MRLNLSPRRCLEGLFDTWGTLGHGFNNNLTLGGPNPIGARKANLSAQAYAYMEEVALNEQVRRCWLLPAHVRMSS